MSRPTSITPAAIVIRDIDNLAEMHEVEELQKEIWGVADVEVFPALAMRPLMEVGGILIGAFHNNQMVGFVFGFPGILKGQAIIHSDMLAVKADFRSRGLGYLLKLAQRDSALAMGVNRITWTFDPLQSRNAHLNFARLGVIADRYYINYYGETSSFLHRFGTDRLWVTWVLNDDRVKSRIERNSGPGIPLSELERVPTLVRIGENNEPVVPKCQPTEQRVAIEIPGDLNSDGEHGSKLAHRWREATRQAFTTALNAGYLVEEYYVTERANQKVGLYLLARKAPTL